MKCARVCIGVAWATFVVSGAWAQGASAILPGGAARGPVTINAPSLDYLDKEHKLVYSGGVVAKQGDATLKASSLTIFLNDREGGGGSAGALPDLNGGAQNAAGGNQIKRIEAAGPVTMISKDQVGTGDSGLYDRAANKLTLIGNVTLSQCANVLKGQRLTYDLASNHAQVQGNVSSLFTPGVSCGASAKSADKPAPEKAADKPAPDRGGKPAADPRARR